ncbi:MAG: AEC family transporter, partial [Victivallales bacterium]
MDKFFELLPYSCKAVISIFLIALAGALLVRTKIVNKDSLKVIGQLVVYIFLPCLLFHKIAASVSLEKLQEYWVLPMTCVVYIVSGLALGWITVKICKPRKEVRNAAIAAIAFNNSGYLPISLITAVTAVFPVFAGDPLVGAQAVSLIAIYLICYSPLLWTIGYSLVSGRKLSEIGLRRLFPPPVIGMLAGLGIGLAAPLRELFCNPAGLLHPAYQAAGMIG